MKNNEKKNILFLSDENIPYAKEFSFLDDAQIEELIDSALFGNLYYGYTIYSVHKNKGVITLISDDCGHKIETTLAEIEDGILSEECPVCRQAKKDMLIEFRDEVQEDLKERGLVVVIYETKEKNESLYIECTKCGAKYYLDKDFDILNSGFGMYCKNWDCLIDAAASEGFWIANDIKSGRIVIKNNDFYDPEGSPFVKHYEDLFYDLDESNGYYERKCDKCNAISILPLGKWECEACEITSAFDVTVEKWDEFEDEVTVICDKCESKYTLSCEDAREGFLDCFECHKKEIKTSNVCPVCKVKSDSSYFCHTCGFPLSYIGEKTIKTQSQYTEWVKNTLYPCVQIWDKMNTNYTKALEDLSASIKNETKLLEKTTELYNQLSQCHNEAADLHNKIFELNEQIKYKNAKISEMSAKTALLAILNQSKNPDTKPNFRNLINKFAIVLNDEHTLECLKKVTPLDVQANSVLVYGYYDKMAGLSFMVLGLTQYEDGDYTLVWINKEINMIVRGESYEKAEIIPINNKTLFNCFDGLISVRDSSFFWKDNDTGNTRKFEILDGFRHFAFPDDVLVTIINHDIQKTEKIWARLKKHVGRDNGNDVFIATLLNEPFDERFGLHIGDDIFAIIHQEGDSLELLGLKIGL